jgi:hypothetical protein
MALEHCAVFLYNEAMIISKPEATEYHAYQSAYLERVPAGTDMLALLATQSGRLRTMTGVLSDVQASKPHAAGEWSVKQVLSHMIDTERILAYRALRLTRGDTTALPGFEQDDYEAVANANARALADVHDEFAVVRAATLALLRTIAPAAHTNSAVISGAPVSLRAVLYIIAGHVELHIDSLSENYGLARI